MSFVHPDRLAKRHGTLRKGPADCESVNFDLLDSQQYIQYVMHRSKWAGRLKGGFRWVFLTIAGIGTGLVAVAIDFALHHAWEAKLHLQHWLAEAEHTVFARYLVWMGINVGLAAVAGLLVCFVEPLAAGSGIPEIKCYLNGVDRPSVLTGRTLVAKAVGIVFSVAAGLPCGKEGPMIHSGAIVGAKMANANAGPLVGPYRQNREARDLTAAGAAAGVAAAFGAPIGGVLFAVEEGASHMNPTILVRCFVCASVSAFTVRFFLGPINKTTTFGTLGTSVPVEFGRFPDRTYMAWELVIYALMGVFGGLAGAAFNAANLKLTTWRKAHVGKRGLRRFLEVLIVTFCISTVNFFAPLAAGSSDMSDYSSSQLLFTESGNDSISKLFHRMQSYSMPMLVFFAIVHYLEACWTYGVGVPSGLFVPSLLAGAAWGRIVGQLIHPLGIVRSRVGIFSLIGATAALSGIARITISLAVILMETTGEAECGLPIFIAAVVAKWTGDLFNHGLYDIHIHLNKVPLLEGHPEKVMLLMRASDVMARTVITLERKMKVGDLLAILGRCSHNGFPVLEPGTGCLTGLIERGTVYKVLALGGKHNAFQDPQRENDKPPGLVPHEEMLQRAIPHLKEVRQSLTPEECEQELDLEPYMNPGCFKVEEDTLLARCYELFRGMGLRHLPVVGPDRTVCGMITRKDLIFDDEEHEHGAEAEGSPAPAEPGEASGSGAASRAAPSEATGASRRPESPEGAEAEVPRVAHV